MANGKTTGDLAKALDGIVYEKNVRVPTRDGSYVSVNVFRPSSGEPVPALLCPSPYGKDLHTREGWPELWKQMLERHPRLSEHSTLSLHTWETNDPELWVPWGYACIRMDVPGAGKSPGFLDPFSPTEARATYDVIEWAAAQEWCTGKVGMLGISYLATAQWRTASEQPPHLKGMFVWEGVLDYYREWSRHGGLLSRFTRFWYSHILRLQHGNGSSDVYDLDDGAPSGGPEVFSDEQLRANRIDVAEYGRELNDNWYQDRSGDFSRISVPFVSAGNWGGMGLHLRGNVEGFVQSASKERWLRLHGGNHRDGFYRPEGQEVQKRFFDHFLRDADNGWQDTPRVLLQVRHIDSTFVERAEQEWPLARTQWTRLYLDAASSSLLPTPSKQASEWSYQAFGPGLAFRTQPLTEEIEITGPLAATLHVSSSSEDMDLFLTVRVLDLDGKEVTFEGSQEPNVPFAQGWLRASHRKLDPLRSTESRPWHTHDELQKLTPGEIYEVQVEIWPSCLVIPAGYTLELLVEGRDFIRRDTPPDPTYLRLVERLGTERAAEPLGGDWSDMFRGSGPYLHVDPADRPADVFDGVNTIHTGSSRDSYLLLPIIPAEPRPAAGVKVGPTGG